jgi:hypothetical protein
MALRDWVGGAAVGAGVTAVAAMVASGLGYLNTDRSQDIQMVNIALSILGGENKETSLPGRKFALAALERFSGVEISDADFEAWARTGTLPDDIYRALAWGSSPLLQEKWQLYLDATKPDPDTAR